MGSLDFAALRRAEVGSRLKVAREQLELSVADVESATKVPARYLEALESGDAGALPSPAYAAGFVRSYARHLGLDAPALVRVYRGEVETQTAAVVPAEPVQAAVPSHSQGVEQPLELSAGSPRPKSLIAGAVLLALLLVVAVAALMWRRPYPTGISVELPSAATRAPPSGSSTQQVALPPLHDDSVTLIARRRVWMRVYEASGRSLFNGILAQGSSFHVPRSARDPRIDTGYPGALAITVGGEHVAPIGGTRIVSGARISPAALRAPRRLRSPKRERQQRPKPATQALPALEVTTEAATSSVTTPLGNAQ